MLLLAGPTPICLPCFLLAQAAASRQEAELQRLEAQAAERQAALDAAQKDKVGLQAGGRLRGCCLLPSVPAGVRLHTQHLQVATHGAGLSLAPRLGPRRPPPPVQAWQEEELQRLEASADLHHGQMTLPVCHNNLADGRRHRG